MKLTVIEQQRTRATTIATTMSTNFNLLTTPCPTTKVQPGMSPAALASTNLLVRAGSPMDPTGSKLLRALPFPRLILPQQDTIDMGDAVEQEQKKEYKNEDEKENSHAAVSIGCRRSNHTT